MRKNHRLVSLGLRVNFTLLLLLLNQGHANIAPRTWTIQLGGAVEGGGELDAGGICVNIVGQKKNARVRLQRGLRKFYSARVACLLAENRLFQPAVRRSVEHGGEPHRVPDEELQPPLPGRQEVSGAFWPGEPRAHHSDLQAVRYERVEKRAWPRHLKLNSNRVGLSAGGAGCAHCWRLALMVCRFCCFPNRRPESKSRVCGTFLPPAGRTHLGKIGSRSQ